jgi:hypothetical protein
MIMTTSAMMPTTNSDPDQLDRLITADRFGQLLALAQSGHSLAALRLAILEAAIAVRTGQPVSSPDYV